MVGEEQPPGPFGELVFGALGWQHDEGELMAETVQLRDHCYLGSLQRCRQLLVE